MDWNWWEKEASDFLSGKQDEPPPQSKTRDVLALLQACKAAEQVLPKTPETREARRLIKKALGR